MRKLYLLVLLAACFTLAIPANVYADSGIFQTYIVTDVNAGGNSFQAGGINSDAAPTYNGTAFGTVSSFTLNGGEVKTFKNGISDVFGATIFYSIEAVGTGHTSFTGINLPFDADLGGGDQRWKEEFAGVDVLAGLAPGDYELQVYWEANTSDGLQYDSNFGNNFTGTFTVAATASVPTLGQWGLIFFGLLLLCTGAVVVWRRQYKLKEAVA